ncbi:MAG: TrbG/VirB9 family P-type conjugative transfer protein [Neisseriaceae bacterium]|nr:TrbG/VirB9 family P-type conjugative transfer protein [Neisseriaceae bacterium]
MRKTALFLFLTSFFTIQAANACVNECPAKPVKKSVKKTVKTHTPSGVVVNGIRYVSYDKDTVYTIPTAPGIVSEIIFDEDESVEYHRFGFGAAWDSEVTAGGNILVFKSKDAQPETNLLVHTDKRDYVILLVQGNANWTKNPKNSRATFSTRFKYFDYDNASGFKSVVTGNGVREFRYYDYDYRATENAQEITPIQMYDDGVLTYIKFKDGTPRGTIYRLDKKKKPHLINSNTDKFGKTVIHGIYTHYIIRIDEEAVEIRRNSDKGIRENRRKTTDFGTRREVNPKAGKTPKQAQGGFSSTQGDYSGNLNYHPQNAAANANDQALLDAQAEYEAISNE